MMNAMLAGAAPLPVDLDLLAARYAAREAEEAEVEIDALVLAAVVAWRIHEATLWNRVRFRARLIRAAARSRVGNRTATPSGDR